MRDSRKEDAAMPTDELPAVPLHRLVRLAAPLAGPYCDLAEGEMVKISEMPDGYWRVERAEWRNSLTISNVLCGVPWHFLIFDEPND
jgi:hypothetical protein